MNLLEVKLLRLGWLLICISIGCLCCHCSALIRLLLSGNLGIIPQTLQLVTQNRVLFLRRKVALQLVRRRKSGLLFYFSHVVYVGLNVAEGIIAAHTLNQSANYLTLSTDSY